jgi:hypothetical protein
MCPCLMCTLVIIFFIMIWDFDSTTTSWSRHFLIYKIWTDGIVCLRWNKSYATEKVYSMCHCLQVSRRMDIFLHVAISISLSTSQVKKGRCHGKGMACQVMAKRQMSSLKSLALQILHWSKAIYWRQWRWWDHRRNGKMSSSHKITISIRDYHSFLERGGWLVPLWMEH